jgi:branched-chain amino acid transport system ATP-binding protein
MLVLDGIDSFYGSSQALFGVSLEVGEGEVVGLLGRNGMGKTTTVHSIFGLVVPKRGRIVYRGQALERRPSHEIARRGLGLVPEGRGVFSLLTVEENLIATARTRAGGPSPWDLPKVYELFPRLGERRNQLGSRLSGGEQQMLAVGRALMTNPELLILDEATEGLAPLIRDEIWACIRRLKDSGHAILVIDKHIERLAGVADRHYILEKGQVVWNGPSAALLADPALKHRYLGV